MLAVMVNGLRTEGNFFCQREHEMREEAVFTGVNAFREFQIVFQGELPAQKYAAGGQGGDFIRRKPVAEQLSRYGQIACSAVRGVQKMFEKGRVDEIVAVNETQIAPGSAPHAQISGGGNASIFLFEITDS